MGNLNAWIVHRARLLGLDWPGGVADACGIERRALDSIVEEGGLGGVRRSARGYFARALKVSVRELESLAAGKIDWIADGRLIDFDRLSPATIRQRQPGRPIAAACPPGRGVLILGRIIAGGAVEHFENGPMDEGPRLSVRYAGLRDAFALQLAVDAPPHAAGNRLVFQPVLAGELAAGDWALITCGESELRKVEHRDAATACLATVTSGMVAFRIVQLSDILRAGRLIDVRDWRGDAPCGG